MLQWRQNFACCLDNDRQNKHNCRQTSCIWQLRLLHAHGIVPLEIRQYSELFIDQTRVAALKLHKHLQPQPHIAAVLITTTTAPGTETARLRLWLLKTIKRILTSPRLWGEKNIFISIWNPENLYKAESLKEIHKIYYVEMSTSLF